MEGRREKRRGKNPPPCSFLPSFLSPSHPRITLLLLPFFLRLSFSPFFQSRRQETGCTQACAIASEKERKGEEEDLEQTVDGRKGGGETTRMEARMESEVEEPRRGGGREDRGSEAGGKSLFSIFSFFFFSRGRKKKKQTKKREKLN